VGWEVLELGDCVLDFPSSYFAEGKMQGQGAKRVVLTPLARSDWRRAFARLLGEVDKHPAEDPGTGARRAREGQRPNLSERVRTDVKPAWAVEDRPRRQTDGASPKSLAEREAPSQGQGGTYL